MRTSILILTISFAICGIFTAGLFGNDKIPSNTANAVQVSVDEGSVLFTPTDESQSQFITAGYRADIESSGVELSQIPFPAEMPVAFIDEQSKNEPVSSPKQIAAAEMEKHTLSISLTDALGEPIPKGTIAIGEKELQFTDGKAEIPDLPNGQYTIKTVAEGYASKKENIFVDGDESIHIILEYVCFIDCWVYAVDSTGMDNRIPEKSGVQVNLWKGYPVHRPVKTEVVLSLDDYKGNQNVVFRRESDGIRVIRTEEDFIVPSLSPNNPIGNPIAGDLLIGLSANMLRLDDQPAVEYFKQIPPDNVSHSKLLRFWDDLTARSETINLTGLMEEIIEFKRNDKRFYTWLRKSKTYPRGEIIAQVKTDENGHCRYENLPAGSYFVQAQKENQRSEVRAIHPASGRAHLFLAETCNLYISVKKVPMKIRGLSAVTNANVKLQSNDRSGGIKVAKTSQNGSVSFEKTPFGSYTLEVTPPANSALPPQSMQLILEEPKQLVNVEYEIKEDYEISGKVFVSETKEPVKDFAVKLYRTKSPGEDFKTMGDYGFVKTDVNGDFRFENVIPGMYSVEPVVKRSTYVGFVLPDGLVNPDNISFSDEIEVEIADQNVEGIEIPVVSGIETSFSGKVLNRDGSSVENAQVYFDKGQFGIWQGSNSTNDQGEFAFSIVTAPDKKTYDKIITAIVYAPVKRQKGAYGGYGFGFMASGVGGSGGFSGEGVTQPLFDTTSPDKRLIAKGNTTIQCKAGDKITGIEIVLEEENRQPSVTGTIMAKDGKWPVQATVMAVQNSNQVYGQIYDNGTYRIDGLQPGKFQLQVTLPMYSSSRGGNVNSKGQDYCDEFVQLVIPEDGSTLEYDIELTPASFLKGKIIDQKGNPVAGVQVTAKGKNSNGYDKSNDEGQFWLVGLRPGVEHTLEIYPKDVFDYWKEENQPIGKMDKLLPGLENIIIKIQLNS